MKFTTLLEQHSQAIRLGKPLSYAPRFIKLRISDGLLTLSETLFQKISIRVEAEQRSRDYMSEVPLGTLILTLSFSLFTRRY